MGTVKAATLIFISGGGLVISSANEGKSGFIYSFAVDLISYFSRAHVLVFHQTLLNSNLLTLNKAQMTASCLLSSSAERFSKRH